MTIEELINKLNEFDNKQVDVLLFDEVTGNYFGIVADDIYRCPDGDIIIDIS